MLIIHKVDDFIYSIFPDVVHGDLESLKVALTNYYTFQSYKPKVTFDDDFVNIEIDIPAILSQENDFRKVVSLCEKGKYDSAKPILNKLIELNPTNSEYHRIMGQILSEKGNQDEAINCLIDALRWNSNNGWALLMMGNIFSRFKKDVKTAMKYYDQALIVNPDDYISINNIGATLMREEKYEEAKKYFLLANRINGKYPNTHFSLGFIAKKENDYHGAFKSFIESIKNNTKQDALYNNAMEFAFLISKDLLAVEKAGKYYLPYRSKLEHEGDCTIEIVEDNSITTPALIEFAENYNREMHIVKHKSDYPLLEHLIMHELVHLDLVIQARNENKNRIFISNQSHKREFLQDYDSAGTKLQKLGIIRDRIDLFLSSLFDGLNKQVYNAPIDLFIENYLHDEYPELRPYQFGSLLHLQNEAIKAVTDKQVVEHSPKDVISKSKILNIVGALQLKDLYGIDLIKQYKAEHYELNLAKEFYREFLENKDNKQVAVEYDMVQKWAEKLKIDSYFELIDEVKYRTKRIDLDNILKSIENDPYDMESDQPFKESEMSKFQQSLDELGTNMAVVMFMVDALQYFENKPIEEIKKIALEIAMLGTQGISPAKDNYIISSISGKKFSGYHLLAYYYVSWAIAIPEMLANLEMPYDREYQMALKIHNPI